MTLYPWRFFVDIRDEQAASFLSDIYEPKPNDFAASLEYVEVLPATLTRLYKLDHLDRLRKIPVVVQGVFAWKQGWTKHLSGLHVKPNKTCACFSVCSCLQTFGWRLNITHNPDPTIGPSKQQPYTLLLSSPVQTPASQASVRAAVDQLFQLIKLPLDTVIKKSS